MTNILSIARNVAITLVCGFGVASTTRGMHTESVVPYYAQLAAQTIQASNHTKQAILQGNTYVGAASK